jgi:membrane protease YdiL (CAAX protease family)
MVIIFAFGKLTARDVGLRLRQLPLGLCLVMVAWEAVQLVQLALNLVVYKTVIFDPDLVRNGWFQTIGLFTTYFISAGLAEEIGFRGFLLPQLHLKFKGQWRLLKAVLVSEGAFALLHIPARLSAGVSIANLADNLFLTFLAGLFFVFIYLETNNLFLAVGLHTLYDMPTPLFKPLFDQRFLLILVLVTFYLVWKLSSKKQTRQLIVPDLRDYDLPIFLILLEIVLTSVSRVSVILIEMALTLWVLVLLQIALHILIPIAPIFMLLGLIVVTEALLPPKRSLV